MTTNVAASVRQRLLNQSRDTGEPFQNLLVRYGIERLLYRISVSSHAESFVLKGATLFYVWTGELHRPTKDLDVLRYGSVDIDALADVFGDIIAVEVEDDGLAFDENVSVQLIRAADQYGGTRVKLVARLAKATIPLQVDVGAGDAVVPAAELIDYPSLLGMPQARLHAYRFETAIAEKCEAMVKLGLANSRMKDFYDIFVLARDFDFEADILKSALHNTFERRGTPLPKTAPLAWTAAFTADAAKVTQWSAFLQKSGLVAPDLTVVVGVIAAFLGPLALRPGAPGGGIMGSGSIMGGSSITGSRSIAKQPTQSVSSESGVNRRWHAKRWTLGSGDS